ncbi:DUF6286 domain-containing Asp23/Gls24 family envelope stress response protein [Streptomyces hypolithicus]
MVRAEPGEEAADRGTTVIADRAVRRIVSRAAEECMGQGGRTEDAGVIRRGGSARVRVGIGLRYPADSAGLGGRVQDHVTARTAELTGLNVHTADVTVSGLRPGPAPFRQKPAPQALTAPGDTGADTSAEIPRGARRRSWSARRLPAALAALVAATAGVALLYDIVAAGGRTAARAQDAALDRLADAAITGPWLTVSGVGAALLGAWLIVLALTPGARRLPMAAPDDGVRAALARGSARALLRDAALDVPGVTAARVRLRRSRRVRVRVTVAFGDPGAVRTAVSERVGATALALGTAQPKRLRIKAVRDANWRPPHTTGGAQQEDESQDESQHESQRDQERGGPRESSGPHETGA